MNNTISQMSASDKAKVTGVVLFGYVSLVARQTQKESEADNTSPDTHASARQSKTRRVQLAKNSSTTSQIQKSWSCAQPKMVSVTDN